MCGIIGYVGTRSAQPILLEGLRTLEYRGYDSAGMYVSGTRTAQKAVGPIDALAKVLTNESTGTSGIAHTRWATHGTPTFENAHPHCDGSEELWIVHNGIIDNWRELKEGLLQQGVTFTSETDTEVLAKLLGMHYQGDVASALRTCAPYLQGTFGLAIIDAKNPETIVTARWGSPLVLGIGSDGNFVASDPSALLAFTKDVIYLEDGDMALLTSTEYKVEGLSDGNKRNPALQAIAWDKTAVQKDGYEHFMRKEIAEAPEVVANTIRGRLIPDRGRVKLGGLESILPQLNTISRLDIVGCGSAYYAGLVGSYMLETYAGLTTRPMLAHEYRYHTAPPAPPETAVLGVSQSGETADTLAAIKQARTLGYTTLGMVNVVGSTITRETHAGVHNHAGPEIAVASTKAFISQLVVMSMLTVFFGRTRTMDEHTGKEIVSGLKDLPELVAKTLVEIEADTIDASKWLAQFDNALFLGRQSNAPLAGEGALKLKEVAYIHAEAYAGGELKHGPMALLDEGMPVIAVAPNDHVFAKMCSNLEEVKARRAPILAVTTDDVNLSGIATHTIQVPKVHPVLQPILLTLPLHLLAYHVGVARGLDVDKPRNLAKSVTVE